MNVDEKYAEGEILDLNDASPSLAGIKSGLSMS